ncbi:helix-turn-helix domain-containing protein [Streptomyces sp. T028]|uniref:helix-turn-helix domain-containing protein n=1 Tax=Streptomyces sp. T028 TaxID=3394379 RepID=UPI003A843082
MPAPLTIAARRAMVKELMRQEPGISARNIAARLGVGKDTIRRDVAEIRLAQSQAAPQPAVGEPESAPDAPDAAPEAAPPAPPEEPPSAPDAPPAEDRLTVAYDDQLLAGLATLAEAGHTPEDAIRLAVTLLARAYEGAWRFGLYPHGVRPRVRLVDLYPYNPKGTTP